MSRAVVGYEPGTRRPIHADLGPARARSSDAGLARFSDIVIPGDEAGVDGSDRTRAVVAALERHQGDKRAAALELGMSVGTVVMVASWARRKAKQA